MNASLRSTVIKRLASLPSITQTRSIHTQLPKAFRSPLRPQQQQQRHTLPHRTFTSTPTHPDPSTTLSTLLARERTAEQVITRNSSVSPALAELQQKILPDWTVVDGTSPDGEGGAISRMIRKKPLPNGAKVTLTFHCQDTLVEDEPGMFEKMFEGEEEGGDGAPDDDAEEEEEGEEISPPLRFETTVSRAGTTLHLNCVSEDAVASVEGATITTGDGDVGVDPTEESFRGPDLEELPEDVQKALDGFLVEGCGVDEDVAAFVAMWADYREQVEYVRWLDGVVKVVGK